MHRTMQPDDIAGLVLLCTIFLPFVGTSAAVICLLNGVREAAQRDYTMSTIMLAGGALRLLAG